MFFQPYKLSIMPRKTSNKCTIPYAFYLLGADTGAAYFLRPRLPIFFGSGSGLFFFLQAAQGPETCGSFWLRLPCIKTIDIKLNNLGLSHGLKKTS